LIEDLGVSQSLYLANNKAVAQWATALLLAKYFEFYELKKIVLEVCGNP
jgi:hypothetical protein